MNPLHSPMTSCATIIVMLKSAVMVPRLSSSVAVVNSDSSLSVSVPPVVEPERFERELELRRVADSGLLELGLLRDWDSGLVLPARAPSFKSDGLRLRLFGWPSSGCGLLPIDAGPKRGVTRGVLPLPVPGWEVASSSSSSSLSSL